MPNSQKFEISHAIKQLCVETLHILVYMNFRMTLLCTFREDFVLAVCFFICFLKGACSSHAITLLTGSDLHFYTFEGILVPFPGVPDDAQLPRRLSPGYVSPIQVTVETGVEPSGAFNFPGTVTATLSILVPVPCRESLAIEVPAGAERQIRNAVT